MLRPSTDLRNKYSEISEFFTRNPNLVFITNWNRRPRGYEYYPIRTASRQNRTTLSSDTGLKETLPCTAGQAASAFADLEEWFDFPSDI